MNVLKINNANAAKIYSDANKKLNSGQSVKNEKQLKHGDAAFEKSGVSISHEAKNLKALDFAKERIKTDLGDTNKDIPTDKINRLKALVRSGSYNIPTDALAAAVVNGVPRV